MSRIVLPRVQPIRLRTSGLQFLLALVLSLALWTFVSFTNNPPAQAQYDVPVTIIRPSDDLMVVDPATGEPIELEASTELQVAGAQLELDLLNGNSFSASVDLSEVGAGLHSVPITYEAPRNVRVRSLRPATLNVRLAARSTQSFTVTAEPQGELPFSFNQTSINVTAQEVVASGPQDLVARINRVVAQINRQGRTTSFTEEIPLVALDQDGNPVPGITLTPETTNVSVRIVPRIDVQRVSVVPNTVGDPAGGYYVETIDWSPKLIEVIAPEAVSTFTTEPITLTGRTESLTTAVPLINPDPEGIITRLPTNTVTVTVQIAPFQVPSINVPLPVPVVPINIGPDLEVTTQQRYLDVTATGSPDQVAQLRNPDVVLQATVDLGGLGPGTYPITPAINLPPGLQLVGPPPEVTVTISATPTATPSAAAEPTEGD